MCSDPEVGLILVIGGTQSANTRHLWELCREYKPSYLVHSPEDVQPEWLEEVETVGVTAGASTPDYVIEEVEEQVRKLAALHAPAS
jgi:4-hydroxy-3-methylbut-2-enyl diphosphate reductase